MWLINWKLHFLQWKTHSLVLKFGPQNAENRILGLEISQFSGAQHAQSPPSPKKEDKRPLVDTVGYSTQTRWLLQILLKPLGTKARRKKYIVENNNYYIKKKQEFYPRLPGHKSGTLGHTISYIYKEYINIVAIWEYPDSMSGTFSEILFVKAKKALLNTL